MDTEVFQTLTTDRHLKHPADFTSCHSLSISPPWSVDRVSGSVTSASITPL